MFEMCTDLSLLNEERINLIRSGNPSILVNKEYAKCKASLLSGQERDFKRIPFYPVPIPTVERVFGITNAYWEDDDPYTLFVEE